MGCASGYPAWFGEVQKVNGVFGGGCFDIFLLLQTCRQRWGKAFVQGTPSPSPLFHSFEGRHALLLALLHPLPASFNLESMLFAGFDTGSREIRCLPSSRALGELRSRSFWLLGGLLF